MGPADSRPEPFRRLLIPAGRWARGPLRRASQVPRSICRRPPSSTTPVHPAVAYARCFTAGARLHPIGKVGRSHLRNEAESGSLALRL